MSGILVYILIAVLSYLLGSLNFGVILSKFLKKDDVREHGSGNAGTTNMLRSYGKGIAVLTIIGDMAKVGIAIVIAKALMNDNAVDMLNEYGFDINMFVKIFAGLFCVMGHIFPCYFRFKGGKGVATSGGMVFIVDWRIALILLAIFFITVIVTKYVSLGSILMAIFYPVFMFTFGYETIFVVSAVVFALIVIVAHRENIVKLIKGTESKITDKKAKK